MSPASAPTLLKKLGQLFMVGVPGLEIDASTLELIQKYHINNFIYFKRNVDNPGQLKKLSRELRRACSDSGLAPPLIAVDQEGGSVARLSHPFTEFPDARVLAEAPEPEKALRDYALVCAEELKGIGVNYNLAPVLDVCVKGRGYFMEKRSLGGVAATVARLGCIIIKELQLNGIAACAKHFPGLGAAVVDPHLQLPSVTKTAHDLRQSDLRPFIEAVHCGAASIMTSHTIYRELDPENPATMSKWILTDLLRSELGYQGVVITDDLEMGAIVKEGDLGQAAAQAFGAGADLLLICHRHEKVIDALEKTAAAVQNLPGLQERLQESIRRVALLRHHFAAGV